METTNEPQRALGPAGGPAGASGAAVQLRLFDAAPGVPARVRAVLAGWALVMAAEVRLERWRPVVVEALRERYSNERTAAKAAVEAARLFRYLSVRGAAVWGDVNSELVAEWCWAASRDRSGVHRRVAQSTARNRQWAALAAFGEAARLGAPIDPEALVGARVARPSGAVSARPLVFAEAEAVRVHADAGLASSRRSVAVALSFAAAGPTTIAAPTRPVHPPPVPSAVSAAAEL